MAQGIQDVEGQVEQIRQSYPRIQIPSRKTGCQTGTWIYQTMIKVREWEILLTISCHTRKSIPHRRRGSVQMDLCDPGAFFLARSKITSWGSPQICRCYLLQCLYWLHIKRPSWKNGKSSRQIVLAFSNSYLATVNALSSFRVFSFSSVLENSSFGTQIPYNGWIYSFKTFKNIVWGWC